MSALKGLSFTTYTSPNTATPEQKRRQKLLTHLHEQFEIAKAQAEGHSFTLTKRKWLKNDSGERMMVELPKRLKQWWSTQANGTVLLTIRYGAKLIEFEKGKAAIQLKSREDLLELFPKLIAAVEAGEFDGFITAATNQRKFVPKKAA
jgi:hypothetical protein